MSRRRKQKQAWGKEELELARLSLAEYGMFMDPGIRGRMAEFHYTLADHLQKCLTFQEGYTRLIINAPPRHGKTQWVGRYAVPWAIGRFPWLMVMFAAHTSSLVTRQAREITRYMERPEYKALFGDRFTGKRTQEEIETGSILGEQFGYMKFGGVDGGFTGLGANVVIIDDPYKTRKEAESETVREGVWDWFNDDMMTRLENPKAVIVMHTRWHTEDLAGRLIAEEPDEWKVLRFPYLQDRDPVDYDPRPKGKGLWPGINLTDNAYPNAETPEERMAMAEADYLAHFEKENKRNAYGTAALLQNAPIPKEGGGWREDSKRYYDLPPDMLLGHCHRCIISVDCSYGRKGKENDPQGVAIVGQKGNSYYLIRSYAKKVDFVELRGFIKRLISTNGVVPLVLVEDKALGPELYRQLKESYANTVEFKVGSVSKEARYEAVATVANDGRFYIPTDTHQDTDTKECIKQLWSRNMCKHDDMGDAVVQAILHCEKNQSLGNTLRKQVANMTSGVVQASEPGNRLFEALYQINKR